VLGAHRAGVTTIIIPEANRRDLEEVPANIRRQITFIYAQQIDDVLAAALCAPLEERATEQA
jgi:ATP-dependent Lon protease